MLRLEYLANIKHIKPKISVNPEALFSIYNSVKTRRATFLHLFIIIIEIAH